MTKKNHRLQGLADLAPLLYLNGVKHIILCPGSRNAPIINSFISFGKLECLSIVDERSAAYFAIGIAQKSKNPVAIVCTSGTAALNFAPAITEAYYQGLPLIAITADRPPEWIDQGDGQTIRQQNIYGKHIKYEKILPVETEKDEDLWFFHRILSESINMACQHKKGPVHINVPLREPLYDNLPKPGPDLKPIHNITGESIVPEKDIQPIIQKWKRFSKKMIIAGSSCKNEEMNHLLNNLSDKKDIVVIAENISNISGEKIIDSPEVIFASIQEKEAEKFQPDLLIKIGDAIVSKRMKIYLKNYKPMETWQIGNTNDPVDTFRFLTHVIKTDPIHFLSTIPTDEDKNSNFSLDFHKRKTELEKVIDQYMKKSEFSDFSAVHFIYKSIKSNAILHLANSSPVRLSQLYSSQNDIEYFSNRGTSGIDGCVSTASGTAYVSSEKNILICGDLAFLYDSNALWNKDIPKNLKIIVLNNTGGNIFQLIKTGDVYQSIAPFLETRQKVNIAKLVEAFGIKHFYCDNMNDLKNQWNEFYNFNKTCVFEIKTDMQTNTKVFKNFFSSLIK